MIVDRRSCLALAAIAAAATSADAAASSAVPWADLAADLVSVRDRYALPALAVAVAKGGERVAAGVTGVRVLGTNVAAAIDDRFHLGSDTKAMTALLAGMMVDEGRLQWDSTIGAILSATIPGLNPALAAVTIEQLLSHSGGIPTDTDAMIELYFSNDGFKYNLRDQRIRLITAWRDHAPETKPGTEFHYANLGYIIAGAMIETVSQTTWEELIRKRIFDPLGLATAGFGPQATTGRLDAPVGHQVDDGKVTPMLWGPAADLPPVVGPAGTAHMSVLDFATWAGWNAGGGRRGPALVKPETLARIHRAHIPTGRLANPRPGTPQEGQYCMGWGLVTFGWTQTPVLTHNGSNGMNLAKVLVDLDKDIAIATVTNFPGARAEDALNQVTERLYRRFAA
jgi:CubicO group peptidase (beta-lactamase class C family)